MQALVEQFIGEHDNIKIKTNTIQWADFYQRSRPPRRPARAPTSA